MWKINSKKVTGNTSQAVKKELVNTQVLIVLKVAFLSFQYLSTDWGPVSGGKFFHLMASQP